MRLKFSILDEHLALEDALAIIDDVHMTAYEKRYYEYTINNLEWKNMTQYAKDYFYQYKFANDTVV